MATYVSKQFNDNANYRPDGQNSIGEATFTISFADGAQPVSGDILKFCKIGENVEIVDYELVMDKFDSNGSAALAGKLGITASDACLIAGSTVLQTNTTGAKTFAGIGGDVATSGGFAVKPFPVQTSAQAVLLTLSASAGTAYTTGTRNVVLRIKYQYAYPETYVTGVTGVSSSNLLGTKTTDVAVRYTYNGNAP